MENNSVTLHRIIKTSSKKLFRAFSDPVANAFWFPPYGFLCTVQEMDFRVGGRFKMTFINFTSGASHSFNGEYKEIKDGEYVRYTDTFDDPNMPGIMTTSVTFKEVSVGTELTIVQQGIPDFIPVEMCYLGWQESLDKLTRLVEPEIPDA